MGWREFARKIARWADDRNGESTGAGDKDSQILDPLYHEICFGNVVAEVRYEAETSKERGGDREETIGTPINERVTVRAIYSEIAEYEYPEIIPWMNHMLN